MNKILLTWASLGLATGVLAQATVSFNNTVGASGRIIDQASGDPLAAGTQITVQLLYGPPGTPVDYLAALTPFTTTLPFPGQFSDPTPKALPGIAPGAMASLAVRGWTGAWPDPATAATFGAWVGHTRAFDNPTGGYGTPPAPPLNLNGWRENNPVPISSGGVIKWGASTAGAKEEFHFYLFKVALPPEAVAYGAAWKRRGDDDTHYSGDSTNWYLPCCSAGLVTGLPIEFRQAAGYATPPTVVTNLQSSTNFENGVQLTIIPANYTLLPPPRLTDARLAGNDLLAMTLHGITNRIYSLQYSTNLADWNLLALLTNTSGTLTFTNSPPAGSTRGFYRVKEGMH